MHAGEDPGFVGDARGIRAESNVVAAQFEHAQALALFLSDDVAEDAALFLLVVVAAGAQFVQHAAGNESRGGQLCIGVFEFLAGVGAEILEDAHVLDAGSPLRSLMRCAARRRNCSISASLAFHRWRSWCEFSTNTSWAPMERILS